MKKVKCTVLYSYSKEFGENYYTIKKILVKHKNENIMLFENSWVPKYHFFQNLYSFVLMVLKNNNFYVHKWNEFNTTFYDIDFVNIDTLEIERFALTSGARRI